MNKFFLKFPESETIKSILLTTSQHDREFSTNTNGSSVVEIKSDLLSGRVIDRQWTDKKKLTFPLLVHYEPHFLNWRLIHANRKESGLT